MFLLVSQFSGIDASRSSEWFSAYESITASSPGHPGTGGVPATPPTDGFPSISLGSGCPFVGPGGLLSLLVECNTCSAEAGSGLLIYSVIFD